MTRLPAGAAALPENPLPGLPVYVINMERDTERRAYMAGVLASVGIEAEFVRATVGRDLSAAEREAAYDRKRALRTYGVEMMPSEIGCYLSHHRLYERMVRENTDVALILEDDVRIEPSLPGVVRDLLTNPFQDWLVVRLDCKRRHVAEPKTEQLRGTQVASLTDGGLYRLQTHVLGVGATLVKRAGAARMIAYGYPVFMPIDHTMDRFWENGILPYVVRPFPVLQTDDFGTHSAGRTNDRRVGQAWPAQMRRRVQRLRDSLAKRWFNLRHK